MNAIVAFCCFVLQLCILSNIIGNAIEHDAILYIPEYLQIFDENRFKFPFTAES